MAVFLPYPRRRLPNQQAGLGFGGGGMDGGGDSGDGGITYQGVDPYNDPATGPTTDPDYGSGGTWDPRLSDGGAGAFPSGNNGGNVGPGAYLLPGGDTGNENKFRSESGYGGGFGGNVGGGMSFGAGIGVAALSGLFTALGGILSAQEAGRQAVKLKQTPANSRQSIAAASRRSPPNSNAPSAPSGPSQPMLGSSNSRQSPMAAQLQSKMQGLLGQVGSPQLKASRFGVGRF